MNNILKSSLAIALITASGYSLAATTTMVKNPLSVHVLNLQTGLPSEGVSVLLDKKEGDKWIRLNSAVTNDNGRIAGLYPEGKDIEPGNYRVTFETGDYYAAQKQDTFFTDIPVIINVKKSGEHYHVPLLLSQYGYSTYRGS